MQDNNQPPRGSGERNAVRKLSLYDESAEKRQESLIQRERDIDDLLVLREEEAMKQQERLKRREMELEELRDRLKADQYVREKKLQQELDSRQAFFADRESKLIQRQSESEKLLMQRETEAEALRFHLSAEILQREAKLHDAHLELQQEKERYNQENRERLDRTSKKYVVEAIESLQIQETKFHEMSENWSKCGAGALIIGLVFFAAITLSSLNTLPAMITLEFIVFSVVKGLIAVALLGALARYAFLLSNSYVREALKNADRRHAINFGKFYLESYGAAAEWSQVKEAFEHWNISGSNAFSQRDEIQLDGASTGKLVSLLEQFGKSLPKPKVAEKFLI